MTVWKFMTKLAGRRATSGIVVDTCEPAEQELLGLYDKTCFDASSGGFAAWGKIAAIGRSPWAVYQVHNERCGIAACGNAAGAAAAVFASAHTACEFGAVFRIPDGSVRIEFAVSRSNPPLVQQRWYPRVQIERVDIGSALLARGLNTYFICRPDEVRNLLDRIDDPCSTRIATVDLRSETPVVKFLTRGGREAHGGAPLTGLGTLSIAANKIGSLAALKNGIETPWGFMTLPHFDAETGALEMPAIEVEFAQIE